MIGLSAALAVLCFWPDCSPAVLTDQLLPRSACANSFGLRLTATALSRSSTSRFDECLQRLIGW